MKKLILSITSENELVSTKEEILVTGLNSHQIVPGGTLLSFPQNLAKYLSADSSYAIDRQEILDAIGASYTDLTEYVDGEVTTAASNLGADVSQLEIDITNMVDGKVLTLESDVTRIDNSVAGVSTQLGTFADETRAASWYGLSVNTNGLISGLSIGSTSNTDPNGTEEDSTFRINANNFIIGASYETPEEYAEDSTGLGYATMLDVDNNPLPALSIEKTGSTYDIVFNGKVTINAIPETVNKSIGTFADYDALVLFLSANPDVNVTEGDSYINTSDETVYMWDGDEWLSTGEEAKFQSTVFINALTKPDAPSGGTYASGLPTSTPTWVKSEPTGDGITWYSTFEFTSKTDYTVNPAVWSEPTPYFMDQVIRVLYSEALSQPTGPGTYIDDGDGTYSDSTTNWVSDPAGLPVWSATSNVTMSSGQPVWSPWVVAKVQGADGYTGTLIDIQYIRSETEPLTEPPAAGWSTTIAGTTGETQLWQRIGSKNAGDPDYIWGDATPVTGEVAREITIYKKGDAVPGDGTYNFVNNSFTPPTGWSEDIVAPDHISSVYAATTTVSGGVDETAVTVTGWSNTVEISRYVPDAKTVLLTSTATVISYASNGDIINGADYTLTAEAPGFIDPYFKFSIIGGASDPVYTNVNTRDYTPPATYTSTPIKYKVDVREGPGTTSELYDILSVAHVIEGSDNYTVILDNESHTIGCDENGNPIEYTNSNVSISVYKGSTQLDSTASVSPGDGEFYTTVSYDAECTGPSTPVVTGLAADFGVLTSITGDAASREFTIKIGDGTVSYTTINKIQTFTKSKDGRSILPSFSEFATWTRDGDLTPDTGGNIYVSPNNSDTNFGDITFVRMYITSNGSTDSTDLLNLIGTKEPQLMLRTDDDNYGLYSITSSTDYTGSFPEFWHYEVSPIKTKGSVSIAENIELGYTGVIPLTPLSSNIIYKNSLTLPTDQIGDTNPLPAGWDDSPQANTPQLYFSKGFKAENSDLWTWGPAVPAIGDVTSEVVMYAAGPTAPAIVDGTYDFSTGAATVANWSQTQPSVSATDNVYVITTTVSGYIDQPDAVLTGWGTYGLVASNTTALEGIQGPIGNPGNAVNIVFKRSETNLTVAPTTSAGNIPTSPTGWVDSPDLATGDGSLYSSKGLSVAGGNYVWSIPSKIEADAVAEIYIYSDATTGSAPATPTGSTYNFTDHSITIGDLNWKLTPQSLTADLQKTYILSTLVIGSQTDTSVDITWTGPAVYSQRKDGEDGVGTEGPTGPRGSLVGTGSSTSSPSSAQLTAIITALGSSGGGLVEGDIVLWTDTSNDGGTEIYEYTDSGSGLVWQVGTGLQINGNSVIDGTLALTGDAIVGGTLDASTVSVTNLNATNISTGTLSSERLDVDDIYAESLKVGGRIPMHIGTFNDSAAAEAFLTTKGMTVKAGDSFWLPSSAPTGGLTGIVMVYNDSNEWERGSRGVFTIVWNNDSTTYTTIMSSLQSNLTTHLGTTYPGNDPITGDSIEINVFEDITRITGVMSGNPQVSVGDVVEVTSGGKLYKTYLDGSYQYSIDVPETGSATVKVYYYNTSTETYEEDVPTANLNNLTIASNPSTVKYVYSGSTWEEFTVVINGNLLVTGSIKSNAIDTGAITNDHIAPSTITPTELDVADLQDKVIKVTDLTADRVTTGILKSDPTSDGGDGTNPVSQIDLVSGDVNLANGKFTFDADLNGGTLLVKNAFIGGWSIGETAITNGNTTLGGTGDLTLGTGVDESFNWNSAAQTLTAAGWTLDSNSLYSGTKTTQQGFASAGEGITINSDNGGSIHAEGFYINADGSTSLRDADIANSALINGDLNVTSTGALSYGPSGEFEVSSTGIVTATSVNLTGSITAESGQIGDWTIDGNSIFTGAKSLTDWTTSGITLGNGLHSKNFYINADGSSQFKGELVAPSGQIGGWTLSGTSLTNGNLSLNGDTGTIQATGTNGTVTITADGIIGNSTSLGLDTFILPSDGSAPTFSSGTINKTIYNVTETSIIQTGANVHQNGGVRINEDGIDGFDGSTKTFDLGTDGTLTIGDVGGEYLQWSGSALQVKGSLTATTGTIGGWEVVGDVLQSTNISLDSANNNININAGGDLIMETTPEAGTPSQIIFKDDANPDAKDITIKTTGGYTSYGGDDYDLTNFIIEAEASSGFNLTQFFVNDFDLLQLGSGSENNSKVQVGGYDRDDVDIEGQDAVYLKCLTSDTTLRVGRTDALDHQYSGMSLHVENVGTSGYVFQITSDSTGSYYFGGINPDEFFAIDNDKSIRIRGNIESREETATCGTSSHPFADVISETISGTNNYIGTAGVFTSGGKGVTISSTDIALEVNNTTVPAASITSTVKSSPDIVYVGGKTLEVSGSETNDYVTMTDLSGGISSVASVGDCIILIQSIGLSANVGLPTLADGYTSIKTAQSNDTRDTAGRISYRFAGIDPTEPITISGGSGSLSNSAGYTVMVFRGVDINNPIDVTALSSVVSNTMHFTPPSITPTTIGSVIVTGGMGSYGTDSYSTTTPVDSQLSLIANNSLGDVISSFGYLTWDDVSGTFSPSQFTWSGTASSLNSAASFTIALRPSQDKFTMSIDNSETTTGGGALKVTSSCNQDESVATIHSKNESNGYAGYFESVDTSLKTVSSSTGNALVADANGSGTGVHASSVSGNALVASAEGAGAGVSASSVSGNAIVANAAGTGYGIYAITAGATAGYFAGSVQIAGNLVMYDPNSSTLTDSPGIVLRADVSNVAATQSDYQIDHTASDGLRFFKNDGVRASISDTGDMTVSGDMNVNGFKIRTLEFNPTSTGWQTITVNVTDFALRYVFITAGQETSGTHQDYRPIVLSDTSFYYYVHNATPNFLITAYGV